MVIDGGWMVDMTGGGVLVLSEVGGGVSGM